MISAEKYYPSKYWENMFFALKNGVKTDIRINNCIMNMGPGPGQSIEPSSVRCADNLISSLTPFRFVVRPRTEELAFVFLVSMTIANLFVSDPNWLTPPIVYLIICACKFLSTL